LGKVYEAFSAYNFSKSCEKGGAFGKDWINDRIWQLLHSKGCYFKKLKRFRQLENVIERLKFRSKGKRVHGGSTNALICQIFHPDEDLVKACKPRPRGKGISCLTELDFKPKRNKLNLFSVFRSQYFDTKAYGNLISLAMLLSKVCLQTDYIPGTITSTANNITFDVKKRKKDQVEFYNYLSSF
jgi:thymidylate synthase